MDEKRGGPENSECIIKHFKKDKIDFDVVW